MNRADHKPPSRIVCAGASAGGLEALSAFLKALPGGSGMAFVVIQHLEPHHKSALTDILSRETALDISEAGNNTRVEPGHAYVIPPNVIMTILKGRLKLTSRTKRADGRYLPIDIFMTSLAKDQGERAVGVILSGTGTDGTLGAKAIKDRGGAVFAQSKRTARYFAMPESVIAGGSADLVLAPEAIARELARLAAQGHAGPSTRPLKSPGTQKDLDRILALLRDLTGVDFLHYKQTTIAHRIARRMAFHNVRDYPAYHKYIKADPAEADILRKDILIPVTHFFREPGTFAALRKEVFPLLAVRRAPRNPVRMWVPACSSGEEVYSLAIAFCEFMEERRIKPYLQIFGTDLSEAVIAKARTGLYAADISAYVSPLRLRRFFVKTAEGYRIAKHIRERCIFARHDMTSAPPLSNMDIVSCRNLLIYLDPFLQNKALSTLHYALKPAGFLVLGASESVSAVPELFTAVDKTQKIYSKNPLRRGALPGAGTARTVNEVPAAREERPASPLPKRPETREKRVPAVPAGNNKADIAKLKKEFARTLQRLNAISEEKDTFNEELKAAGEELQSSNEELQSTNEELETSKEELQSTNEELLTLNEELQDKNAELARLNGDLNNVFASTNIPLIIVGGDLRIKRFTPAARKVMNLIPADLGRPIGDIKLKIDIPALEETLLDVIEEMAPRESEVQDKEGRWYSVRVRPYRTVDNKIEGALLALYDIDALKRVQETSRAALDYVQAIIDTMREPLAVLNRDARVLSVNRSFREVFGLQPRELESKSLYALCGRQWDSPALRILLEKVLPQKTQFNDFEMSFDLPAAGRKTMLLNGRQVRPHGKDEPMILLVIEDVTERKNALDIIKRDSATMERTVEERSRELLVLQRSLERAKHLSDVGTLAATIAHELRNTLGAISAAEYNIRKRIDDPRIAGSLANIVKKISEGERIINNVLSYSRIKVSRFEPVILNDILALCAAEVKERALVRGVTISAGLASTEKLSVEADPVQLTEVFSNILNNSLDAVADGTGLIAITSGLQGQAAYVSIKDNGEGMAAEDLKKALDPFFTTKAKGTGLGLAVCNQILMLHDGAITIESEKGKGTAVRITLPLQRRNNAEITADRR